jgi:N-acetylmuramoyl-L-alanine amidase
MPTHTVSQGECLSSIALHYGFADWRTIYNHASNASFRQLRPNPNLIYPGDQVFIPETETRTEAAPTDNWTDFKVEHQKTFCRIRVMDGNNAAFANKKYSLDINGQLSEGQTGGDGMIEKEIPPDADSGTLTIWFDNDTSKPGVVWNLKFGTLDPYDTTSGVQARLKNLGYDPGPIDGILGPLTAAALRGFQSCNNLTVNGTADTATKNKLKELHDGA